MMEIIKTLLGDLIRKIAPDFRGEVLVEIPENKELGDYTSNIAFHLAKVLNKLPQETAKDLAKLLKGEKLARQEFSKIEATSGFINFFLSEKHLFSELSEILKKKNNYGKLKVKNQKSKVNIDFISANPTGPLTVGNGRGGFYGDVLANILKTQGNKVVREYYINDRGGQVLALGRSIKMAQGLLDSANQSLVRRTGSSNRFGEPKEGGENLYKGAYIYDLAKKISKNLSVEEAGQKAVELVLKTYIKPVIKKIGIKYDIWFSEKSLYPPSHKASEGRGKKSRYEKVMEDLMQKELIYEKDGATWMKTSELGDNEDRVLIKSNGDETYFMSDILYHLNKFKVRKFDEVIDIWGADHHGDVPRVLGALKALGIDLEHLKIILTQFVRLVSEGREVKISKRAGTFVMLEELINEVGIDAARFFFLMYSPNTHMDFDIALAKERSEKNPVYYVQYAHARIASILRKSKSKNFQFSRLRQGFGGQAIFNFQLLKNKEELNLIRKLVEFPEILAYITESYEVQRLTRYVSELAREFHNFYEKYRVITDDEKLTSARLVLVMATKIVVANALDLMGIKAPDKM